MLDRLLWQSPSSLPLALLVIAVSMLVVLWLYPPQVRQLPPMWRWMLPALRGLALGVLALSLLKPMIVRPRTAEEEGAVVIMVDHSRSMSVRDTGRSAAQLVAIADALQLLPQRPQSQLLAALHSRWQALHVQLDEYVLARSALDYAKLTSQGLDVARERIRRLSEQMQRAVQSMAEEARPADPDGHIANLFLALARSVAGQEETPVAKLRQDLQQIGAAISFRRTSLEQALYDSDEEVRRVCDRLRSLTRFELVERLLLDPDTGIVPRLAEQLPLIGYGIAEQMTPIMLHDGSAPVAQLPLRPTGAASDLTGAARALRDRAAAQHLQAVLLFSDGRQTGGDPKLREAVNIGVPIFTVAAGAPITRDVSIARVSLPARLFSGETGLLRADIRGIGFRGEQMEVQLRVGEQLIRQEISFETSQYATVELPVRLDQPGAQPIELRIDPQPGEASLDNNSARRLVKVLSDKVRVLALAGRPGWDFQYLRNALSRVPWVELEDHIIHAEAISLPAERMLQQDVILLSDVELGQMGAEQWSAVRQLASERGGSVIVVAGDARLLAQYGGHEDARVLLPYREGAEPAWRTWPGREPFFRLVPASGAEQNGALRLDDDAAQSRRRWDQLPAMYQFMSLPELKPAVRTLLVERDSGSPVLTENRIGLGRVLFFGASETWRWRQQSEHADQDRFWLQLVRYAAEEPYAVHSDAVAFDADELVIEPAAPLRVRARVRARSAEAPSLRIMHQGRHIRTQAFTDAGPAGGGRYETLVTGLPAGDYELQLEHPLAASLASLPLRVEPNLEEEMRLLAGDEVRLNSIASASGGEMIRLEEIDQLPAKLEVARHRRARAIEYPLWDSWQLFCFVLGCLGAEWALRKRFGLA